MLRAKKIRPNAEFLKFAISDWADSELTPPLRTMQSPWMTHFRLDSASINDAEFRFREGKGSQKLPRWRRRPPLRETHTPKIPHEPGPCFEAPGVQPQIYGDPFEHRKPALSRSQMPLICIHLK